MAMLGEQFMVGGEICGAVLSVRFQVLYISFSIKYKLAHIVNCEYFLILQIGGFSIFME